MNMTRLPGWHLKVALCNQFHDVNRFGDKKGELMENVVKSHNPMRLAIQLWNLIACSSFESRSHLSTFRTLTWHKPHQFTAGRWY